MNNTGNNTMNNIVNNTSPDKINKIENGNYC